MKGGRLYMLILGAFLVVVFLSELAAPHKFSWKPTFDKRDKEPFGCYVFDDVAKSSFADYKVVNQTFYRLFKADSADFNSEAPAYLLIESFLTFTPTDFEYFFKLLENGSDIMLCAEDFPYLLEDSIGFSTTSERWLKSIYDYLQEKGVRDSIFYGGDTLKPECTYQVYPHLHNKYLRCRTFEDKEEQPLRFDSASMLSFNAYNKPLAMRLHIGKGRLFLVSTPLMFTNFGILDGKNAEYAFRLLSEFQGKPIIRTDAYGKHGEEPQTPLRYVLSVPPLKWAIYTALITLLLFMAFTARRRQRVIPVVAAPPNRTLGFMQLISNLYYQQHDNGEILKMKYRYFCSELKRLAVTDITDRAPEESDFERLAELSGIETDIIRPLLKNISMSVYRSYAEDMQLKQYIDGMNDIVQNIK